jgi:hypothetical protein
MRRRYPHLRIPLPRGSSGALSLRHARPHGRERSGAPHRAAGDDPHGARDGCVLDLCQALPPILDSGFETSGTGTIGSGEEEKTAQDGRARFNEAVSRAEWAIGVQAAARGLSSGSPPRSFTDASRRRWRNSLGRISFPKARFHDSKSSGWSP